MLGCPCDLSAIEGQGDRKMSGKPMNARRQNQQPVNPDTPAVRGANEERAARRSPANDRSPSDVDERYESNTGRSL
jgi:hypothetical protein